MNFFNKNENIKMVTPMFRGTFDDFYTFINDYVKNKVPYQTKRHKPEHCELCGEKKTLEAAHVRNRDRRVLMQEAFDEIAIPEENGIFAVDLNKYADKIGQMHSDPHNFHFLCRDCHKKYDAPGSTIKETDFSPRTDFNEVKIDRVKNQTVKGEKTEDATVRSMKVGEIVQNYLIPLLKSGKVSAYELEKLKEYDYSEQIFNIKYPLLSLDMFADGYPRYYCSKKMVKINNTSYYVCKEWYEDRNRAQLLRWLKEHDAL